MNSKTTSNISVGEYRTTKFLKSKYTKHFISSHEPYKFNLSKKEKKKK